jgi:hypothetical protein
MPLIVGARDEHAHYAPTGACVIAISARRLFGVLAVYPHHWANMSLFLDRRTQWAMLGDVMLLTPPTVSGQAAVLADSSADVRAIKAARARSNAAIASRRRCP